MLVPSRAAPSNTGFIHTTYLYPIDEVGDASYPLGVKEYCAYVNLWRVCDSVRVSLKIFYNNLRVYFAGDCGMLGMVSWYVRQARKARIRRVVWYFERVAKIRRGTLSSYTQYENLLLKSEKLRAVFGRPAARFTHVYIIVHVCIVRHVIVVAVKKI